MKEQLTFKIIGPTQNAMTVGRSLVALTGAIEEAGATANFSDTKVLIVRYERSSHLFGLGVQFIGEHPEFVSEMVSGAVGTVIGGSILAAANAVIGATKRIHDSTGSALSDVGFRSRFKALLDAAGDDGRVEGLSFSQREDATDTVVIEPGYFRDPHSALILPFTAEVPVEETRRKFHLALEAPGPSKDQWWVQWDISPIRRQRALATIRDARLRQRINNGLVHPGAIVICDLIVTKRRNRETGALFVEKAEIARFHQFA